MQKDPEGIEDQGMDGSSVLVVRSESLPCAGGARSYEEL